MMKSGFFCSVGITAVGNVKAFKRSRSIILGHQDATPQLLNLTGWWSDIGPWYRPSHLMAFIKRKHTQSISDGGSKGIWSGPDKSYIFHPVVTVSELLSPSHWHKLGRQWRSLNEKKFRLFNNIICLNCRCILYSMCFSPYNMQNMFTVFLFFFPNVSSDT